MVLHNYIMQMTFAFLFELIPSDVSFFYHTLHTSVSLKWHCKLLLFWSPSCFFCLPWLSRRHRQQFGLVTHPCDTGYVASWLEQVYTDFTIKWQHTLGFLPAHRHEKPVPLKFLPRLMGCSLTQHPATISIPRLFLTIWARLTTAAMESCGELLVSGDKLLSLFLSFFSKKKKYNFGWSSMSTNYLWNNTWSCLLENNWCKIRSNIL